MGEAIVLRQAPDMGAAEFARWQKLIEVRTGIHLPDHRKAFLMLALSARMRESGQVEKTVGHGGSADGLFKADGLIQEDDYNAYFVSLRDGAQAAFEWACLIDLLTVHETRFFRHPESFDLVRSYVRNVLTQHADSRQRSIQAWSVGCSTGEEVYSLALAMHELQTDTGPFYFGVTGTDISYPALASAREGIYHLRRLIGLSDEQRERHFQAVGDDYYQVMPAVRQRTCFVQGNVHDLRHAPNQLFDIIYCQNLLIYFQTERRRELLSQLVEHLRPGGMLVLAPGEVLRWHHSALTRIQNKQCLAYSHRSSKP